MIGAGIHTLAAEEYHADPCERPSLSASIANVLCRQSPRHAWAAHPRLNPSYRTEESEKFDIGKAAHALLLEGGMESVEVIEADDWRTKAAKEARDEARAAGRFPLLARQWQDVEQMTNAAAAQLARSDADPPVFTDGTPEQTAVWDDEGVLCRARIDWLRDDLTAIDDYKTTSRSASPESWSHTLFNMGCDVQAAFYLRGIANLTGMTPEWRFVVQETYPPYALSVFSLAPDALALARRKVAYAINTWRDCLARDHWPAYTERIVWAEAPPWYEARWLDREAMGEGVAA